MRLFHCGDLHISESSPVTLEEQSRTLAAISDAAESEKPDMIVIAGDVFDATANDRERNAADDIFVRMAESAPVIIVQGNHDRPASLTHFSKLRTRRPIHVAESFAVTRTAIANFVLMPWPSRGRVAAWLGDKASKDAITTAGQGAIRALLAGAKASLEDSDKPTIFVGHIELGAARTDAGQPIAGHCDIEVATEDLLELGADFYALGHIHVPQTIAGVIRYSGSPRQKDFGEALGHGYTIWEEGEIRHVELPSPRWITVDAEWKNGAMVFNGEANPTDIVRLRYSVPEPERAAAAEAAMRFGESFSRFKSVPEIVSGEREMRSEVRSAHTPEEKLAALWESKKNRPERAKEILAKLASVHV